MKRMRFKRLILAAAAFLMLHTPAMAAPIKILAMGTSLTQGYGLPPGTEMAALIPARLKAKGIAATVINAGVSGDTSSDELARLDWSLADRPDAVMLEIGSNDALRGIDPSVTEKNIAAVLTKLKAAHLPVLLLGMQAPRNYGPEYAAKFDPIFPKLAKAFGVLFYPFVLDGVALNPRLNQADGIHPNPAGEKIIVDRLMPSILKLVAQVKR